MYPKSRPPRGAGGATMILVVPSSRFQSCDTRHSVRAVPTVGAVVAGDRHRIVVQAANLLLLLNSEVDKTWNTRGGLVEQACPSAVDQCETNRLDKRQYQCRVVVS